MNSKFHEISQKVKSAVINYPLVLAMAFLMAFTIVYVIETHAGMKDNFHLMRLVITAALGISLMFAVKMLAQRIGRELIWSIVGLSILTGFYFILPDNEKDFTEAYAFVIVPSFILSHLAVACIPFLGKQSELSFWQYNKNLFINFFLTNVFTSVLTSGVLLAIVAVDQLFSLDLDGDIYGQAYAVFAICGSVFIFLLFNERGIEYLEKEGSYPVILKFFTQFILIPLLMIYVIILYFYSFKIVINWELPEGWVSYLVLAYSIIGILALLLVHPLKNEQAKSWVRAFSSIFYYSLLPLIGLLFTAIFTRVLQYGFTEARYYVLLLAIWLLVVVLYFIFMKRNTIKFIPVSLFALGLFSLLVPYLNTFSVAKRSQKNELEQLLSDQKLLVNGKIDFSRSVTHEVAGNVADKFRFLSERDQKPYLNTFLTTEALTAISDNYRWNIEGLFKNRVKSATDNRHSGLSLKSRNATFGIEGFEYAILQREFEEQKVAIGNDNLSLTNTSYSHDAELTLSVNNDKFDFMPLVKKLVASQPMSEGNAFADSLFVEGRVGRYDVRIIFSGIDVYNHKNTTTYQVTNPVFLLRKAE